jgi:flagellar basal body-associated protein FliL
MFKGHLVSNGVIIITIIIMTMTVVVITGAVAGVYQLSLSSCHYRQRFKGSEQKQQVTSTLQEADAMTGE